MNEQVAYDLTHKLDWLSQPVLQWLNIGLFLVGSGFWIEAHLNDQAFSAAIYGDFALRFQAEVWAGVMMMGSALTFIGLVRPVHRWKVVVGSVMLLLNFMGLAYSAIWTGGEMVIGLFCSVLFAPLFLKLAFEGWINGSR